MNWTVPDLCDDHPDDVRIVDPLFRDFGKRRKFHGEILTIKCFEDNSLVKQQVHEAGEGRVLVVDGGGSHRCALLGDLLGGAAQENGWAGLLIFGCVRDVEILKTIDIGVRALEPYPLKSHKRGEGEVGVPVRFGGVRFRSGHYLYADENGIVVSKTALV